MFPVLPLICDVLRLICRVLHLVLVALQIRPATTAKHQLSLSSGGRRRPFQSHITVKCGRVSISQKMASTAMKAGTPHANQMR